MSYGRGPPDEKEGKVKDMGGNNRPSKRGWDVLTIALAFTDVSLALLCSDKMEGCVGGSLRPGLDEKNSDSVGLDLAKAWRQDPQSRVSSV